MLSQMEAYSPQFKSVWLVIIARGPGAAGYASVAYRLVLIDLLDATPWDIITRCISEGGFVEVRL